MFRRHRNLPNARSGQVTSSGDTAHAGAPHSARSIKPSSTSRVSGGSPAQSAPSVPTAAAPQGLGIFWGHVTAWTVVTRRWESADFRVHESAARGRAGRAGRTIRGAEKATDVQAALLPQLVPGHPCSVLDR